MVLVRNPHLARSPSNRIFVPITPLPIAERRSTDVIRGHRISKTGTRIQRPHYAKCVKLSGHEPEKQDKVVTLALGTGLSLASATIA